MTKTDWQSTFFEPKTFLDKKDAYLNSIRSKKTKYKRVSLSPIRYAGGKSLAVGHVIEKIDQNIPRLISPFFGGGSVEIAISKHLGISIIASDVYEPLITYWWYQLNQPQALYDQLKQLKPTQETYDKIQNLCKQYKKGKISLSKLELATYFYFNHNLSYGPSFIGWASKQYLNAKKYDALLEKVRTFECDIEIRLGSFERMFDQYPNDFFYCDPPYFLKKNCPTSQMFKGIYPERNCPVFHDNFDHLLLKERLDQHRGGFVLSYNDCAKMREFYRNYAITYPKWQYTMGQGETRISKDLGNRNLDHQNAHIKPSHEALISS